MSPAAAVEREQRERAVTVMLNAWRLARFQALQALKTWRRSPDDATLLVALARAGDDLLARQEAYERTNTEYQRWLAQAEA